MTKSKHISGFKVKKINFTVILVIFVFSVILILVSCCGRYQENQANIFWGYSSFRDVPGITEEEIMAIEALQNEFEYFLYGMPVSTEAFINEYGEIRGFTAFFCEWLSAFFEIPFKPVIVEWLDLLEGLETHRISFSGEITATPERQEIYFMTSAIASRPLKYYRLAGSISLGEISRYRPIRTGFIEGTITIYTVTSELTPGTFETVLLSDVSLVYEALRSGQIDVFYYSSTADANFVQYAGITAFYFYPLIYRPVSFVTRNPALKPIVSVVEKILLDNGIRHLTAMYNQGEQEYLRFKLHHRLTPEEREYIQNRPIIPVGIDPENYPVSFFDRRENRWRGIVIDILDEISALTGLTFKRVNDENTKWPQLYEMLLKGEIAFVSELAWLEELEPLFIWPNTALMTDYYALISKYDFPDIRVNEILHTRVGLARNTACAEIFRRWFPSHMNNIEFETVSAAFGALSRGEVEMVMASNRRLLYLTHYLELPGFKANVMFSRSVDVKFGFNKNEVILCSIIDKALGFVDTRFISGRWIRRTFDYRAKLAEAQRPWFMRTFVLLMFVIVLLTILFIKNRKEGIKLEALVQERTIKLNENKKELENALETAKGANNSKSIFLASMSHEIRTPMHGIIGFSELALDDNISPKTKNYLSKIKTSAEGLLVIINNILDVSKIEAARMELEKIPFNLSEVFNICRVITSPKAREKGLTLFCYAEPSLDRLLVGDPTKLQQILLNLLSNAVKFTNKGMIKLLSAITNQTGNTTTIRFEVKDSGIGMTPEQIERIFQPFMQADNSTMRKYGGTGLGLTIAKDFIELMGGKLYVESSYGLGSRFYFDLTLDTAAADNTQLQAAASVKIDEKPIFNGDVLVCEDNPLNQQVISGHLSKIGLRSIIAANGKIGIDILKERMESISDEAGRENPFDLIFMDIHMPEMDGLEAAKKIIEMGIKTPIVALTANIMSSDRETYFEMGMKECLSKPFVAHDLWACLLRYIKPVSMEVIVNESDNNEEEQRIELINAFVKGNQTTIKDILDALEAGNLKLAHRIVHTLKGTAGLVDMTLLMEAARNAEQSIAAGKLDVLNKQVAVLENELNAAFTVLAPLIDEHIDIIKIKNQNIALTKDDVIKLIDALDALLEADSFESLNYVKNLSVIPDTEELITQVENMNFKQARQTLANIKRLIEKQEEAEHG